MKKIAAIIIAAIAVILVGLGTWNFINPKPEYSGPPEKIVIGTAPLESSALIYIAQSKGFFAKNGLDVAVKNYDTGAASLNGLLKEEIHIATPAEYALVGKAFQKENIHAIASIDKADYFFLAGRKDKNIERASDLKGKRIGVVRSTIAEFYLGRFLELNGISLGEVVLVDTDISQSENAIVNGGLDAIVSRPPYINAIEKRLGKNGTIWPVQNNQALYAILVGRNTWISKYPELINRLLKSLDGAEQFLIDHPAEAKTIVQKKLNFNDAHMTTVWSQNQFGLALDQSLILAMEDEARWLMKNQLNDAKEIPNFLDYIYFSSLETIKPEATTIIN